MPPVWSTDMALGLPSREFIMKFTTTQKKEESRDAKSKDTTQKKDGANSKETDSKQTKIESENDTPKKTKTDSDKKTTSTTLFL